MSNIIVFSKLSPVKWIDANFVQSPKYHTKAFDSFRYPETLYTDQDGAPFYQPWQTNDNIRIPLLSNFGPHTVELLTCTGVKVREASIINIAASTDITGLWYFEGLLPLNDIPEGIYYLKLNSGFPQSATHLSEYMHIKPAHTGTVLLNYTHNRNDFNIPFEAAGVFDYRLFGGLRNFEPKSEDVVFIDQPANLTLLDSRAHDIETLVLGEYVGSPDYVASFVRHVFRCNEVRIDGVQYSRNEGAQLEPTREDNYGLYGWSLEVRKTKATDGITNESDIEQSGEVMVVFDIIDTSAFGNIEQPAGTNIVKIQKINING